MARVSAYSSYNMNVKLKRTENSDKFRKSAIHFQKFNTYTFAPPGTSEYLKFWTDEADYCMNGYTAEDGDRIPGYFYFYLNYFPINLVKEIEVKDSKGNISKRVLKDRDFPRFYDYDRFFFEAVEEAEKQGKHLSVIKARRKGYSYKVGSMLIRNYYMYRESKGFALAAEAEFLVKDGILTKAWDGMDFIDQHTAWYKKRQRMDQKMHKRASFLMKDRSGVQLELGYKSEIMGVTLKNDPQKARGKAGKLIIFEEAGKFPNLLQAWQIARPSVEQGSFVFGTMIAFGTGGTEGADFESLKELFERPAAYNCLEFENIWDENVTDSKCGFFIPQYANLEGHYHNPGDPDDGKPFMDEFGNTDVRLAKRFILEQRQKVIENASDKRAIDRHIAEQPCFPGDTFISTDKGIHRIDEHPDAWITGNKLTYEVTTSDGVKFRATSNHELYDGKNYRPLSDYKIGDKIKYSSTIFSEEYQYVDIKGAIPSLNTQLKIDEDWATFLGLYMGDGSYYARAGDLQIVFDVRDVESYNWFENFARTNLGNPIIKDHRPKQNMVTVNVYNKAAQKVYDQLGMLKQMTDGSHKRKVCVPDYILKSPKSVVAAFLKGLFDADGYSTSSGTSIGLGLKHAEVLEKVQFLLRGFDIHSKLSQKHRINSNGYTYAENKLGIRSIDVEKYVSEIGFLSKRKTDNIKPRKDRLSNRDYTFGTILSIEEYSVEQVWDVTTKDHTLSANGIWAHNCTPAEAVLNISTNIFPKAELQRHLAYIRNNEKIRDFKHVGELYFDSNGKVKWEQTPKEKQKDIVKYKLDRHDDPTGQIVIWEHPMDDPPYGMYIAGIDPYDHDKSGTNSLGSIFIYKRFQTFEENYETIVAEYTGRPDTANDYYENIRKLLIYYNATALYENEKKGLFFYFEKNHCTYLLADQPGDLLRDIVKDTSVDRKKGIHMNTPIKDWGEGAIRDWLIEEYSPGKKNLTKIYSEALLEELISYNDTGNFDRVMSFMMIMLYRQQLHHVHVKKKKDLARKNLLFPEPIFVGEIMQKRVFN